MKAESHQEKLQYANPLPSPGSGLVPDRKRSKGGALINSAKKVIQHIEHPNLKVEKLHKLECKREQSYANDNKAMQMIAKTTDNDNDYDY